MVVPCLTSSFVKEDAMAVSSLISGFEKGVVIIVPYMTTFGFAKEDVMTVLCLTQVCQKGCHDDSMLTPVL